MWPVARRRAMEEQLSLEEFQDIDDIEDGDDLEDNDVKEYNDEEEEDVDVEKGDKRKSYHYSPSVIKKRGLNTLHQV